MGIEAYCEYNERKLSKSKPLPVKPADVVPYQSYHVLDKPHDRDLIFNNDKSKQLPVFLRRQAD